MPLLKRKTFSLAEPPKDLDPNELVYQVRFTKEIFRDYSEYLKRINLYRQRVWTCKVSGKINLTYEEALVSEKRAAERVQQLPKELVAPALQIIQYSMLPLKDLADSIAEKLQQHMFVGAELYARTEDTEFVCRILKVMDEADSTTYKVARLDRNKKVMDTFSLNREDFLQKKLPYSRSVFKSFIRESTYRSAPWVLHDKLAHKHGISTDLPPHLRGKVYLQNGLLICGKKRKDNDTEIQDGHGKAKREKLDASTSQQEDDQPAEEPIKYPIDDLLVHPGVDDPVFTDRLAPSRDFNVPMDCVGDLLMVWDFCSSFGRLLQLSPFSLEDFESAICHDKGNVALLVETHSSLLRLLMKDNDEYLLAVQKRNRNRKITLVTWTEYLCDILEMVKIPGSIALMSTIKRGHYGILDVEEKLGILRELVNRALETALLRQKLDDVIGERQALGSTIRGQAIEEARKKREEKEVAKAGDGGMDSTSEQNAVEQKEAMGRSESKKWSKKHVDLAENGKTSGTERRSKEERKDYYEREMEKRFVRTNSLGRDRDYNRYWWFRRDGRIFVESSESKQWGQYSSKREVDALIGSLNCKGVRERALKHQLDKLYTRISSELEKRNKELKSASEVRRSSRVRAPPRDNPANAFLNYVNKWKLD